MGAVTRQETREVWGLSKSSLCFLISSTEIGRSALSVSLQPSAKVVSCFNPLGDTYYF